MAYAAILALVAVLLPTVAADHATAQVDDDPDEVAHVLIYSGTVAHRHHEAIIEGIGPIQDALEDIGITSDWEDCDGAGTNAGQCQHEDANPRIFDPENLEQYDALFFFNAGGHTGGSGAPGPLWNESDRDAIRGFVNDGGGIAASHLATDIGAGEVSWEWWDGVGNSAIGSTMPGHPPAPQTANVQVSDRTHPSTRDLPDEWPIDDEFYMFDRSVRGTHHVLMTLDEYTPGFEPGGLAMGQDHPVAWCRHYDGGRIYANALGHFGNLYHPVDGDHSPLVKSLVGGVQWVAGVAGSEGDCGGTVWNNFQRTTLVDDVNGPIGLDIADDGRVYWTEIGAPGHESSGRLRMYDPETEDDTLVHTIETRADALGASEDGVLGMVLDPGFSDNGYVYIYYSPRGEDEDWPNEGEGMVLGHNVVSRFELDATGTEVVDEQEIIRIPKVKIGPDGDGGPDGATTNWPAHTGGAGMDFDSEGDLYIGVGDDVNPFDSNRDYTPIDQRYEHRYDARNTSANTNDLRGSILRITPRVDADGEAGLGATYDVPDGNLFEPGTELTKPEIYAMGFRNPFSVHADPAHPGHVAVGEYGPDAGQDDPDRGPAGIIEWNYLTEPGFHGWPFCTGDTSEDHSYNRFEFPDGPSGERFDCSASEIPNESEYNTGLPTVPGPAVPATLYHQRDGSAPESQGIPTGPAAQEANSGPIYRYDADSDSETKWPEYYDGSWLVYNRNADWWREVKLRDDGSLLTANPFIAPSTLPGDNPATNALATRFGPDGSLYLASWTGGGRGNQGQDSLLIRVDYVGDQEDEIPPQVSASVSGIQEPGGGYVGRALVEIEAEDVGVSGVDQVEYSLDGGDWESVSNTSIQEPFVATVSVDEPGDHELTYRASDRAGNLSEEGSISFTVVSAEECEMLRSDHFTDDDIDTDRWSTVRTGPDHEITVSDGQLHLPILWEVDGTEEGPLSFVGQQVPDDDWTVTTRVTIEHETHWQQAGLMLWESDGNFVKLGYTQDEGGATRFEITADNPVDDREFTSDLPGGAYGSTVWMQLFRDGDTIGGRVADDVDGVPGAWTTHPGSMPVDTDPPRAGEGVMVGPYAGSQFSGPWEDIASFDLVEFQPDEVDCGDLAPPDPTVEVSLDPAEPDGEEGWYTSPVAVTLNADPPTDLEYRLGADDDWAAYSEPVVIDEDGLHTFAYRAAGAEGDGTPITDVDVSPTVVAGTSAGWVFDPDEVTIEHGDTVTFEAGESGHNVVVFDDDGDEVDRGGDFSSDWVHEFTPDAAGSYTFLCEPHGGMDGTLTVVEEGQSGPSGEVEIQLDQTPPQTTASVDEDEGSATVTLEAEDATSGVAETRYHLGDEADAQVYDGPVVLDEPGEHAVGFASSDVAGNVEDWQQVTVVVEEPDDPTDPTDPTDPDDPEPPVHTDVCARHQGGSSFPDAPGSGHVPSITCLAALGVVQGYADGTFGPTDDVSREQLASFVSRAMELAADEQLPAGGALFPDIAPTATHGQAVYKLRNADIIRGFDDGTFRPRQPVTRDQTARFVVNALEQLLGGPLETSGVVFPDVVAGSQYATDVDKLATAGVISGYADGTFGPREPVTRAQMTRFIANALDVAAAEEAYLGP